MKRNLFHTTLKEKNFQEQAGDRIYKSNNFFSCQWIGSNFWAKFKFINADAFRFDLVILKNLFCGYVTFFYYKL